MVIPNTTTASENLPNSTSQRHLLSSSTSSDTTTTTHPFLNSVRPSWLQRTLQVAFFPHSPPSSSSSSLLPTTISPSSSFPCPKPFPRIHRSLLSYLPWKPSKHFLSFFHPSSTSTNTSYFNGFFFFQLLFYIVWFVSMVVMVYFHVYGCSAIHPTSQERVLTSSISSTASFWKKKSECGLNGTKCSPFKDEMELFRCAGFSTKTKVLQETFIGLLRLMEVPKVIGGLNQIYRGDSWICSSAVDAQVISNSLGGCVMVKTLGSQTQVLDGQPLTSVLTKKEEKENDATTITSSKKDDLHPLRVPFSSYFPLTYRVDSCSSPMGCIDLTWIALVVQILALTLCMVSVQGCPTLVLFFIYMVIGYWHVIFISDSIYYDKTFLEIAFASFLPYLTFVYVIYQVTTVTVMLKCTTYFLLDGFLSQVIPLMVGLHFNYIAMLFPSFTFTAIGFREQWPMVLFLALSVLFLMLYFGFYQRSFHHLHRLLFGYLVLVMVDVYSRRGSMGIGWSL
ncbi:hypothetical protein HMI54_006643 [Coelomomyces lativittatus]|nr:hypothetical protein HMI54_006643 [Coelomomyces lativittatus]